MATLVKEKGFLIITDPYQESITFNKKTIGLLNKPVLSSLGNRPIVNFFPEHILIRNFTRIENTLKFELNEPDNIQVEYSKKNNKIYIHDDIRFPSEIAIDGIELDTYLYLIFHLTNKEQLYIVLCNFPKSNLTDINTLSEKIRITDTYWIMDEENRLKSEYAKVLNLV